MEEVIFQEMARKKLLRGAQVLMESVKGTLGPCGHHVLIQQPYGTPLITNDGVTIAKALHLQDPYERMGAELLFETAKKTNENAGDGTTTSILLAHALLKHGYAYIEQGGNVSAYVDGMRKGKDAICEYVKEHSHKVDTYDGIAQVATISAKDEEIGTLVADAINLVEDPRCITCESGKSYVSKVRLQEGMELDASPFSPYIFAKDQNKCTLHQPLLLITNERIESYQQIEHFVKYAVEKRRPLMMFCADIESEVLAPLLLAHMQKKFSVIVFKAPSFGTYQQDILDDLALLCHGTLCLEEFQTPLESLSVDALGECQEAVIFPRSLQIYASKDEPVKHRIAHLKENLSAYVQTYDIQHTYHRIMRLEGKLAILEIGGYTPQEIDEKKMRCEDALQAAFAAMEDGVIAGGGLAFIQAYKALQPMMHGKNIDEEAGMACVFASILQPFLQLMENNYEDGVEMLGIQFEKEKGIGYDVREKRWCALEEEGICDPVKVVMDSLHNAVSIASLLIRCDVALLCNASN